MSKSRLPIFFMINDAICGTGEDTGMTRQRRSCWEDGEVGLCDGGEICWDLAAGQGGSDDVVRKQSHEALGQMVGRMGFKMFCLGSVCRMG